MKKLLCVVLMVQVLSLVVMVYVGLFDMMGFFVYYMFLGYRFDVVYINIFEWVSVSGVIQGVNWGGDFLINVIGYVVVVGQVGVGSVRLLLMVLGDGFMLLVYVGWIDQIVIDVLGQIGQYGMFSFQLCYDWMVMVMVSLGGFVYVVFYVDVNLIIFNGLWNMSQYGSVY